GDGGGVPGNDVGLGVHREAVHDLGVIDVQVQFILLDVRVQGQQGAAQVEIDEVIHFHEDHVGGLAAGDLGQELGDIFIEGDPLQFGGHPGMALVELGDELGKDLVLFGGSPGGDLDLGASALGTTGQTQDRDESKASQTGQDQPKILHG